MTTSIATETFIEVRGHALRVAIEGPPGAPAILLIHSLATSIHVWDAQAAVLARSYRVVRFDLRGHGLSELSTRPFTVEDLADDALAVLDAFGIATAHVGGVSIGGIIAQALALRAPARVRSLMLCNTALTMPPPELWRQRAATARAEGIVPLADGTMERWMSPACAASPIGRGLRTQLLRTPAEAYAGAAEALATADLTHASPAIRVPTFVLVGALDPSTPVASAEALHRAIPGAVLVVVPDTRHLPMVETPELVTAAMLAFLQPPADLDALDLDALGAQVRAEVLGAEHVASSAAATTDLDRDFQTYLTRAAWGSVWARPHFDRRTRSIITLALLAALGHDHELALHIRAMKHTGATQADLTELLLHVAAYAGIPAANTALRIAKHIAELAP